MTSHATAGIDRARSPLIYLNEYPSAMSPKHERLATARWPVSVLSGATRGDRDRSPRYRWRSGRVA